MEIIRFLASAVTMAAPSGMIALLDMMETLEAASAVGMDIDSMPLTDYLDQLSGNGFFLSRIVLSLHDDFAGVLC